MVALPVVCAELVKQIDLALLTKPNPNDQPPTNLAILQAQEKELNQKIERGRRRLLEASDELVADYEATLTTARKALTDVVAAIALHEATTSQPTLQDAAGWWAGAREGFVKIASARCIVPDQLLHMNNGERWVDVSLQMDPHELRSQLRRLDTCITVHWSDKGTGRHKLDLARVKVELGGLCQPNTRNSMGTRLALDFIVRFEADPQHKPSIKEN